MGCYQIKIGIVIPARLESERLPRKVLKIFFGISMIEHVWRRAQLTNPIIETLIATDSEEIKKTCQNFGAKVIMTSSRHVNGLSRVGEVAKVLNWDFYVILQADEILVEPKNLENLIKTVESTKKHQFINLITKINNFNEVNDVNVVKCSVRRDKSIISIFRKSSSVATEQKQLDFTKKICGIFAISKEALEIAVKAPPQKIEVSESIEQMKMIELGIEILGVEIDKNYPAVNTEIEALEVTKILKTDKKQKAILKRIQ